MFPLHFVARSVATALLFAVSVLAQGSISVNPGVLRAGDSATINYSNPNRAGQVVLIEIDNGSRRTPQTATIEIHLDANGNGSASWAVPAWMVAKFNAPDAAEVSCPVVSK